MELKYTALCSIVNLFFVLVQGSREHSLPPDWHGDVDSKKFKKILHPNATTPGMDKIALEKMRAAMDHCQTLPEDFATVGRDHTPDFSTLGTSKIEGDKIAAVTDIFEKAGYDTHYMVNDLIKKGYLKSKRLVEAMRAVDKAAFAPMDPLHKGHFDYSVDIGFRTWMEPPFQIAGSLEYMNRWLIPGKKVLEIGAGTGYMTALLSLLGGSVVAIEHVPELARKIKNNIMNGAPRAYFKNNFEIICADGQNGYREKGPYDLIYVSASCAGIPTHLIGRQLKFGGRMIYSAQRPGLDKHLLYVYHRFRNETDEVDMIHMDVYLPPLTNLSAQLSPSNPYRYDGTRIVRSERWFTGDYEGCYFDRSQKETRNFEDEYKNQVDEDETPMGMRSSCWWHWKSKEITL